MSVYTFTSFSAETATQAHAPSLGEAKSYLLLLYFSYAFTCTFTLTLSPHCLQVDALSISPSIIEQSHPETCWGRVMRKCLLSHSQKNTRERIFTSHVHWQFKLNSIEKSSLTLVSHRKRLHWLLERSREKHSHTRAHIYKYIVLIMQTDAK